MSIIGRLAGALVRAASGFRDQELRRVRRELARTRNELRQARIRLSLVESERKMLIEWKRKSRTRVRRLLLKNERLRNSVALFRIEQEQLVNTVTRHLEITRLEREAYGIPATGHSAVRNQPDPDSPIM